MHLARLACTLFTTMALIVEPSYALRVELQLGMNVRRTASPGVIDMGQSIGRLKAGRLLEIPDQFVRRNSKGEVDLNQTVSAWVDSGDNGAGLYNMSNGRRDYFLPVYTAEAVAAARAKGENPYGASEGLVAFSFLTRVADRLKVVSDAPISSIPVEATVAAAKPGKAGLEGQPCQGKCGGNTAVDKAQTQISTIASSMNVALQNQLQTAQLTHHPVNPGTRNALLTSPFKEPRGRHRLHNGLDIAAPSGTPVASSGKGKVVAAGWQNGYGYTVVVEHENGLKTIYAHMLKGLSVKVGDKISAGTQVGRVGSSGSSTGNHLHYEVRHNGKAIDPMLNPLFASYKQTKKFHSHSLRIASR